MRQDLQTDILIELHIPDFEPAKQFYGALGYEVVWEKAPHEQDGYLVMRSGGSILNFYGGKEHVYTHPFFRRFRRDTPRGYGVEIIIPITDIGTFYQRFLALYPDSVVKELNHTFSHPDFRATDPFGFYLRFVERYNWVDGRDTRGVPRRQSRHK